MNQELLSAISTHPNFLRFARPFISGETDQQIKDAEFVIRKDGLIVNVEGWQHPPGFLIGEVLYAPSSSGDKTVFGQPYRKVTLFPNTHEPVPYANRAGLLRDLDPALDQTTVNPYFARYKQILPTADFIAHMPSERALQMTLSLRQKSDEFYQDYENLLWLLGLKTDEVSLGLTGAPLLGNSSVYHDFDIVFSGSLEQNLEIAKRMRDLAIAEPKRRLFEGGKAWQIRFFNDRGKLMCTFFTYPSQKEAPLNRFSMQVVQDNIVAVGCVGDDHHSVYTPTILELEDVILTHGGSIQRFSKLPLIAYHTASRGDCFRGDVAEAQGALVEITQPGKDPYPAICVIEREGVRNLTPPWPYYYGEGRKRI